MSFGASRSYEDTIFALASAPGRAAIAVVRISGPGARGVGKVFGFTPPGHRATAVRGLFHGTHKIDQALVLCFHGPASYTGEDIIELHIHGGRAVFDAVVTVLNGQPGFRPAEPGEFTRRAVLKGRLDLTAAEAVNDLVNAETEAQREQALRQLRGDMARKIEGWSHNILRSLAHIEAYIDFPDEDIPALVIRNLAESALATHLEMVDYLDDKRRGERLRDGLRIAVVGPPNVGKSSFVNWLSERDVAIVTDQAGTTRDVVEVHLDLGGYPVIVADTAGLRDGGDAIEVEGMRRAREWANSADLRVCILDSATAEGFDRVDAGILPEDLVLLNKVDLDDGFTSSADWIPMSVIRGDGMDRVMDGLASRARRAMDVGSQPALTRARHREALQGAVGALGRATDGLRQSFGLELVAEDLRAAAHALGRVTGRVDVEDLLDIVFRDFCIGK